MGVRHGRRKSRPEAYLTGPVAHGAPVHRDITSWIRISISISTDNQLANRQALIRGYGRTRLTADLATVVPMVNLLLEEVLQTVIIIVLTNFHITTPLCNSRPFLTRKFPYFQPTLVAWTSRRLKKPCVRARFDTSPRNSRRTTSLCFHLCGVCRINPPPLLTCIHIATLFTYHGCLPDSTRVLYLPEAHGQCPGLRELVAPLSSRKV